MKRLSNLDYLRGLAASGIMIYHFSLWQLGQFSADTFLGRVGIYGVSIFYVLSGLTLYYVYHDKMRNFNKDLRSFASHRFYRIFPLMWFATVASILLSRQFPDPMKLFLNLTGLFGFIQWDSYYTVGLWSIGNELVFYAFFIFFIYSLQRSRLVFSAIVFWLLATYVYFSFFALSDKSNLASQWRTYVNPLNQVFLFLGGFLIGMTRRKMPKTLNLILLTTAIGAFIFYPVAGDQVNLVTGYNRLIFTALSFLTVFCFYKMEVIFPKFIHWPLSKLGEASYSVYLLHPLVYFSAKIFLHGIALLMVSIILTLITSYFVYQYFERYFMSLGKRRVLAPILKAVVPGFKSR